MRLFGFCVSIGVLLAAATYAAPLTFIATGTFHDGEALGGSVVIDTATGLALSADLTLSGSSSHFTTLLLQRTWPPSSPFLSELIFQNADLTNNQIVFLFPPVSLVGYTGGALCGLTANCQDSALTYFSNINTVNNGASTNFIELEQGSLEPAQAPEPATCLTALSALGLSVISRLRFKARGQ